MLESGLHTQTSKLTQHQESSTSSEEKNDEQRPAKKQKTTNTSSTSNKKPPKANSAPRKASNIIKLTVAPSQTHLVAVTDDKSIRVFSFSSSSGTIHALTQRVMPKRPCAIQVLPDNATILCGDKFGDVYSLPLLPSSEPAPSTPAPELAVGEFKPSATPLTVHSARNLAALTQQKLQKNFTPRKDTLSTFTNTLLLGHVSMLTDMLFLSHPSSHTSPDGKGGEKGERQYILTSDRDEHIRISRGPPQTHVIEGFCLGHTSFISKICRVGGTSSQLLVSGGGDSWLGVWDWTQCSLKRKFDLLGLVRKVAAHETQVAVSGIWSLGEEGVLVMCEKVKALFFIPRISLSTGSQDGVHIIPLPAYPLDVVILSDKIIISTDARIEGEKRIVCGQLGSSGWEECWAEKLEKINGYAGLQKRESTEKELDTFLYGVANLRKRGPLEDGEEDGAAGGEGGAEEEE
jgi:tRNA (guanine-N(7)-)-methyltransferase subunit TRM82